MKTKRILFAILLLSVSMTGFAQKKPSTLTEELNKLNNVSILPAYINDSEAYMASSYDRTGGNDDGFSGAHSFIRKEGENRLVMADLKGPGVIQRLWTPTPTKDTIQFYFDGEKEPRINIKFEELFTGNVFPFISPLCGNEIGGYFSYIPIPYAKSLKIVYVGSGLKFHQIQYRNYNKKKKVKSFQMNLTDQEKEALTKASQPWLNTGKQYSNLYDTSIGNIKTLKKTVTLSPGDTKQWANLSKGGRIVSITIDNESKKALEKMDVLFRAKWDDDTNYGINIPFAAMFGHAFRKEAMHSLLLGSEKATNYIHFPMPFDNQAQMELHYLKRENVEQEPLTFDITVYYSDKKRDSEKEGRLYAIWNRQSPMLNKPFTILKQEGKGHHVGTLLYCQSIEEKEVWFPTGFFEGDDVATIDGEIRMHGTGSEDYFNGGWYGVADRWDDAFSLPIHGCLDYSIPLARTAAYRLYTSDKVNFSKSYELTIEHDGGTNTWPVDYAGIAFYYGDRMPSKTLEPNVENTSAFAPPKRLEVVLNHFNIQSLSFPPEEVTVNYTKVQNKEVFKFFTQGKELIVKNSLDVPVEGKYKLFVSYFKSPESGKIRFFQRQNPISDWINIHAEKEEIIEKRYIGNIVFANGRAPLTFWTEGEPGKNGFTLHKIFLEKVK